MKQRKGKKRLEKKRDDSDSNILKQNEKLL